MLTLLQKIHKSKSVNYNEDENFAHNVQSVSDLEDDKWQAPVSEHLNERRVSLFPGLDE